MDVPEKKSYPFICVKMMELYIETLAGTAFELRVSPYETIQDVKARIQLLEGIPISQQHLLWQSVELEDDYCLRDYHITDGTTLKLVLALRGGPINTRRIPYEDEALQEMADYLAESGQLVDDRSEKGATNPHVTVIVYHNGDQISFYRIVDTDPDSPADSLGGEYLYEDEDGDSGDHQEVPPVREDGVDDDDDKIREKMKLLRLKMETMTVGKKPKKKLVPHPPSSHRPNSRLRRFPSSTGHQMSLLNRNPCLPPVTTAAGCEDELSPPPRVPVLTHQLVLDGGLRVTKDVDVDCATASASTSPPFKTGVLTRSPVAGGEPLSPISPSEKDTGDLLEPLWHHEPARLPRKWDPAGYTDTQLSLLRSLNSRLPPATGLSGGGAMKRGESGPGRPIAAASSSPSATTKGGRSSSTAPIVRTLSSSLFPGGRKKPSMILESLDPSEVQAMSGVITTLVQSANKSRGTGTYTSERTQDVGRLSSTDSRLLKLPTALDGHILSPNHHLPPVKQKRKTTKRCYVCTKKTGLATSYLCRCGKNYCALHRYAESHDCTFDYKTEGRKLLEQSNPVITAPKLPKI